MLISVNTFSALSLTDMPSLSFSLSLCLSLALSILLKNNACNQQLHKYAPLSKARVISIIKVLRQSKSLLQPIQIALIDLVDEHAFVLFLPLSFSVLIAPPPPSPRPPFSSLSPP